MKRIFFLAIIALLLACPAQEKDVLVKVDGSTLSKAEFEKYVSGMDYQKLSDDKINDFLENWAEQEILYLEAKKKGIDQEDSVRLVIDQYRKNLLAMELVRREFGATTVTEAEIQEYFDMHKEEFLYAVKLGQIVLPNLETARRTLEEINAGADFFKLARERSLTRYENPDNPRVLTEYLPRGAIADYSVEEIIFNMKPGAISDPIPYLQGTYLIVKMMDKTKVKTKVEYAAHRDAIYNYLLTRKYQDFLAEYVDKLKAEHKIVIDLSPLKK